MSSPSAGLGQSHRRHRRSPGAQAAELCRVWWELCVRERRARDRNHQLLQDFGHLETQLGLLWARTDAVRKRKDWVSTWMLDPPLCSCPGRHLPDRIDHLRYQTPWPHLVSPRAHSPEPAAFLASRGAGPMWGACPQPTQPRAFAGAGSHPEDTINSGMGRRGRAANRVSRRLLWRRAWEKDRMETACEEPWDRVPSLWCKEKPGGDTAPLDQGGIWGQEPWGQQAWDDRPEETLGSPRCRLNVRESKPGKNREPGEGVQLKGMVGHLLIQGAGQMEDGEEGDGCSAMGQIQEEGEAEEGLAEGWGWQEVGKNETGNREEGSGGTREEAEGRGSKEDSALEHVQASAKAWEDEEGPVKRGGQVEDEKEEGGLVGAQGFKEEEEDSKEEEGLVKGLRGQTRAKEGETEEEEKVLSWWGAQEEGKEEEGLAGRDSQEQGEEEEGSEKEEGLMKCEDQEQGEEEEEGLAGWVGQEQSEEEESSEQEGSLVGQQGGQEGEEEDEGSKGLAVGGAEGHMQQEEEEDAESDLVLGPQGGPGKVELGRGGGRDPCPAWNSLTLKAPHEGAELRQDSAGKEEEEAESEADEAVEAALAPPGNTTEPRVKGRALESHGRRRGSQGSPPLKERSRKVDGQGFWDDQEELGADLETSLREDQSLDDQDNFYD